MLINRNIWTVAAWLVAKHGAAAPKVVSARISRLREDNVERSAIASWLQVDSSAVPGDVRPTVSAVLGPAWGYHLDDVNLALGNLVADVAHEEATYR